MHYRLSHDGAHVRSDAQELPIDGSVVDNIGRAHAKGAIAAGSDVKGRAAVAAAWAAPATAGSNDADANEKKNKKEVDVG